jgi:hypothetical protein
VAFYVVPVQLEYVGATKKVTPHYGRFLRALGYELRAERIAAKRTQEDMIFHGFSVRHWQRMEAGQPINIVTLLRACDALGIPVEKLVASVAHHLRKRAK